MIVKIIIYLVLVGLMLTSLRRRSSYLYCGLIGYSGEKETMNFNLLHLIAMQNDSRGGDSAGIYYSGNEKDKIHKIAGHKQEKFCQMFATSEYHKFKAPSTVVIGHSRKASVGARNKDNAHPYHIKNVDSEDFIIGAHNGTIYNTDDLLEKYNVKSTHGKTDSYDIMCLLLFKYFNALSDYQGAAALLWTYSEYPDSLYVFKGASKPWTNSTYTEEERPLFYVKENGGIYVSSMKEPFQIYGFEDKDIKTFENNIIYKIHKGSISKLKVEIDRSERVHKSTNSYYYDDRAGGSYGGRTHHGGFSKTTSTGTKEEEKPTTTLVPFNTTKNDKSNIITDSIVRTPIISLANSVPNYSNKKWVFKDVPNLMQAQAQEIYSGNVFKECYSELNDPFLYGDRVIYWRGRYYRNGHLANGSLELDLFGYHPDSPISKAIVELKDHKSAHSRMYYFINGLMLKARTKLEYDKVVKALEDEKGLLRFVDKDNNIDEICYMALSKHLDGVYPFLTRDIIGTLGANDVDCNNYVTYLRDGSEVVCFNDKLPQRFWPEFSEKVYSIKKNGNIEVNFSCTSKRIDVFLCKISNQNKHIDNRLWIDKGVTLVNAGRNNKVRYIYEFMKSAPWLSTGNSLSISVNRIEKAKAKFIKRYSQHGNLLTVALTNYGNKADKEISNKMEKEVLTMSSRQKIVEVARAEFVKNVYDEILSLHDIFIDTVDNLDDKYAEFKDKYPEAGSVDIFEKAYKELQEIIFFYENKIIKDEPDEEEIEEIGDMVSNDIVE